MTDARFVPQLITFAEADAKRKSKPNTPMKMTTQIRVMTGAEDGYVSVVITDNGGGFSVDQAMAKGGKGLANQQRRAQAIGAEIMLHSSDAGTTLTLRLPEKRPQG